LKKNETYKIFIIDDEEPILKMMVCMLARKGHAVETASSGEQGLRKIKSTSYDLIITDMKMPGISGDEILKEIRRIRGHTVSVIGMSGTPWLLDSNLFDAVLSKPFCQEDLLNVIKNIMLIASFSLILIEKHPSLFLLAS
jgi:DNA-binding response OmpR family regulator